VIATSVMLKPFIFLFVEAGWAIGLSMSFTAIFFEGF
jgi:hypothetical protein